MTPARAERRPEAPPNGDADGESFAPWRDVRRRLLELASAPAPLLVVTDFDGTLAPISQEPMGTRILPLGRSALRRLARLAEARPERLTVAVLSGRGALDVAGRVRVGGLRYLGNHGLEGGPLPRRARPEGLAVELEPASRRHLAPARALADAVEGRLGRPEWLLVERKGPSVAFHFRRAHDADAARTAILEAIDDAETELGGHGLARLEGRKIIEFRPADIGGKGAAVERLLRSEGIRSAIMLGDDRTDAEAFRVLSVERRAGRLADSLAVAIHGAAETPPEVVEEADLLVAAPRDAARVLSTLAAALERETVAAAGGLAPGRRSPD